MLQTLLRDVLPPGTTLRAGAYRTDYALGRGGFGITYRALQVALNRLVAIKEYFPEKCAARDAAAGDLLVTRTDRSAYDRALQRFMDEGRILADLNHPSVARVFDLFEERGTAYLVMDLLPGRSLRAELEQNPTGRLPEQQVTDIVGQVASALATVHKAGIYHLDVKPDNIILAPKGRAVLIDFGAARRGFTRKDTQAFTPEYAPLELLADQAVGPGTDLFELGMMTHELLTGSLPPSALARLAGQSWNPTDLPAHWTPLLEQVLRLPLAERPSSVSLRWPTTMRTSSDAVVGTDAGALAAALASAEPGGVVRLGAGEYRLAEGMVLDRPLRLEGAGMDLTTVMAEQGSVVLHAIAVGRLEIRELTLRGARGVRGSNVLVVEAGEALLEHCRLTGSQDVPDVEGWAFCEGAALLVRGAAIVTAIGCVIEENSIGVEADGTANLTIERCALTQNNTGLLYRGNSVGIARGNTFEDNGISGIYAGGLAQPTLEGNTCNNNGSFGISVHGRAHPVIRRNTCNNNGSCGIACAGDAVGTVAENICNDNMDDGIHIMEQARPIVENNTCQDNIDDGIAYRGFASGIARSNTCSANGNHGIGVGKQAAPMLQRNILKGNVLDGMNFKGKAGGLAEENECTLNGRNGIRIAKTARVQLRESTCSGNKEDDTLDERE